MVLYETKEAIKTTLAVGKGATQMLVSISFFHKVSPFVDN